MAYLTDLDLKRIGIKKFGDNCLISDKASIYGAERIILKSNIRIDDFSILSAGVGGIEIGNFCHIACYASLIGNGKITLEDYVGISGGVRIYSSTDSFKGDALSGPTIPKEYTNVVSKDLKIGKFSIVGANSIVMASIGENCSIGCLSLVKKDLKENGIYVGIPCKKIGNRSMNVYNLEKGIDGR